MVHPRPAGVLDEDRAHLVFYDYNDVDSLTAAAERYGDDLAGVIVSPFRHDARFDQELVDPAFARSLRSVCDAAGAALILDEVRAGFRLAQGSSWGSIRVAADLSAWSKAIANGYAIAAVLGSERFRAGAEQVFVTGSFWFAATSMAAAVATIRTLGETGAQAAMEHAGRRLLDGLAAQASSHGLQVNLTGPPPLPFMTFAGDRDFAMANLWTAHAVQRGAYFHPWHNWFLSAAHTDADVDRALEATDEAFVAVRRQFSVQ